MPLKSKTSKAKPTLKERLAERRKELSKRGQGKGLIFFPKEGTTRFRVVPVGEENDFALEVTQFYLGPKIQGVFSPSTFGDPCPIMELRDELKASKKAADKALGTKLIPKKKYLIPAIIFTDPDVRNVAEGGVKLIQVTADIYGEMIDSFLDKEYGDFMDIREGYDFKLTRTGSGKNDTTYSIRPTKHCPTPKGYTAQVNLEEMVRGVIPSYEEVVEKLAEFQSGEPEAEKEEKSPSMGGKLARKKKRLRSNDEDLPF